MDVNQFKELMSVFQQQQQQIQLLMTHIMTEKKTEGTVTLTNISTFENFNAKQEKFSCYIERFENYCSMKGVKDSGKMAQLLCNSIGSIHYNALSAFVGPDKSIQNLSYDELVKVFKQLLVPKKNVIVSQHQFLNVYQKNGESIADFVAALQREICDCEFKTKCECDKVISISDIFLRIQFIRGLRDNWIKEQVLQSNLSSFDEILNKAVALEASKIDSTLLSKPSHSSFSDNSSVGVAVTNSIQSSSRYPRTRSRSSEGKNVRPRSMKNCRSGSQTRRYINFQALGIDNMCFRCGKTNHKASNCYINFDKVSCTLCKRKGHVSRVCIQSLLKNSKVDSISDSCIDDCSHVAPNTKSDITLNIPMVSIT